MWWSIAIVLILVAAIALRVAYIYVIAPPEQPWDPKTQK